MTEAPIGKTFEQDLVQGNAGDRNACDTCIGAPFRAEDMLGQRQIEHNPLIPVLRCGMEFLWDRDLCPRGSLFVKAQNTLRSMYN